MFYCLIPRRLFSSMWWYKLVVHWSKRDYLGFGLFIWVLIFCILTVARIVQGGPLDLPFMAGFSFAMIPIELLIIIVFQKYSSNVDKIIDYPALLPGNFAIEQLLESGKILVFFYSEWCPFCRNAFHYIASLSCRYYKVFRVDLSDENNPIWSFLKIKRVPALIAFDGGKEFWRREATYMIGLRKADFNEADSIMNAKTAE
jgi:thiol-disulfide isomerase/thioredoxin